MKRALWSLCAALGLLALLYPLLRPEDRSQPPTEAGFSVLQILGGDPADGFERALEPRPFVFPRDHGPHPSFRSEWWHYTGNLQDQDGRRFGYQLTFFRFALTPENLNQGWRASQIYMAHFALTNAQAEEHQAHERFSRAALGLAGAKAQPFRVWVEDWSVSGAADELFPIELTAAAEGATLHLRLEAGKPWAPNGDRGLSRKGEMPGNASYYYSFTRLPTRGVIGLGDRQLTVTGASWMDREWSTSALEENLVGWDWFALQLDDGRDLMFYRLRQKDGDDSPFSRGTLVEADDSRRALASGQVELSVAAHWRSPADETLYPARWELAAPEHDIRIRILPLVADQEIKLSFQYWEGAVSVAGVSNGSPVTGRGYVEMTGYGGHDPR